LLRCSPLSCLAKKPKHETSLGLGALGTASVSSFAPPLPPNAAPINFSSDDESPSMIRFNGRTKEPDRFGDQSIKKVQKMKLIETKKFDRLLNFNADEGNDDLQDFKPELKTKKSSGVSSY